MDRKRFEEIMNCSYGSRLPDTGCGALKGLLIINKYVPEKGILCALHSIIYSVSINEILDAGITEEDAKELSRLHWLISDDSLARYIIN